MELNVLTRWESVSKDLHALRYASGLRGAPSALLTPSSPTLERYFASRPRSSGSGGSAEDGASWAELWQGGDGAWTWPWWLHAVRRFAKGFLIGYAGKATIGLLGVAFRAKLQLWRLVEMLARKKTLLQLLGKGPITHGLFLGGLLSGFETLVMLLSRLSPLRERLSLRQVTCIAGLLAGASLGFIPGKEYRSGIAVFFAVRALESAGKLAAARGLVPSVPHVDVLIMCLASARVLSAWFYDAETLDPGYVRFLNIQGAKHPLAKKIYGIICLKDPKQKVSPELLQSLNEYRHSRGYEDVPMATIGEHACNVLHPSSVSCTVSFVKFFLHSYLRAMPVYIPIYVLPALIFKLSRVVSDPWRVALRVTQGILQSSMFLASYCSLAWYSSCVFRNLGVSGHPLPYLVGCTSGASVALEVKSRRIELALYVLAHALQSSYRALRRYPWFHPIPHGEILLFMASSSVLLYTYLHEPRCMRPSYTKLIEFFFGSSFLGKSRQQSIKELEIKPFDLKKGEDGLGC